MERNFEFELGFNSVTGWWVPTKQELRNYYLTFGSFDRPAQPVTWNRWASTLDPKHASQNALNSYSRGVVS